MAKKKKPVTKKKKTIITSEKAPEPTQMSEAIAEEIVNKHDCSNDNDRKMVRPLVIKGNHLRQAEINNRVQLVMSFNPQIARNQAGEWVCSIGYDGEKGITTIGVSALDAVLTMFDQLT